MKRTARCNHGCQSRQEARDDRHGTFRCRHDLRSFFRAFATFDARVVAEPHLAPYLSMGADGKPVCFTEHADIGACFQSVLDDYHSQGGRTCGYEALDATPIGAGAMLVTATWSLYDDAEGVVSQWRESYNLAGTPDAFKVFASVDHA